MNKTKHFIKTFGSITLRSEKMLSSLECVKAVLGYCMRYESD